MSMMFSSSEQITFKTNEILGKGSSGTIVYRGKFGSRDAAVKAIFLSSNIEIRRVTTEIDTLIKCDNHENVIRYLSRQYNPDTGRLLLALELCPFSLKQWIVDNTCISPTSKENVLHQCIKGLAYLHENGILHRDLKPANILLTTRNDVVIVKLSDFGISKFLPDGNSSAVVSCVVGTDRWRAPEILIYIDNVEAQDEENHRPVEIKMKRETDIFSLGCIFYYTLTGGKHPFGNDSERVRENILNNTPAIDEAECPKEFQGNLALIKSMVDKNMALRPASKDIEFHHMFWPAKKILQYLVDVSNALEKKDSNKRDCIAELEKRYQSKICTGTDGWIAHTSTEVASYLKSKIVIKNDKTIRLYTGDSVIQMVRAIRNLNNHYAEVPKNIKDVLGETSDIMIMYWVQRFPLLIHNVWMSFQNLRTELSADYYPQKYKFVG